MRRKQALPLNLEAITESFRRRRRARRTPAGTEAIVLPTTDGAAEARKARAAESISQMVDEARSRPEVDLSQPGAPVRKRKKR